MNRQTPDKELSEKWKKDDRFWIWGAFYYNKDDNRIFPPKRQEDMGYTVNFANPKSIWLFAAMICFFLFVVIAIILNTK